MTLKEKIQLEVLNYPGMTLPEIEARFKDVKPLAVAQTLYSLSKKGYIIKKGLRGRYEYHPSSTTVVAKAIVAEHTGMSHPNPISAFSPRELLEELKRRGYVWDKMWMEERKYVEYSKI